MSVKPRAMRDALLDQIHRAMAHDPKIFFVSADFGSPVLDRIRADHPARFVNVGVAEQNLINISSGLALEGYKVFAYAIAPFITMRCFEQIRVSLALLSEVRPMNVNLIGVGAGYSYVVSGPTHQCYEDITLMRGLPNFQVLSPSDHITTENLFGICAGTIGPKYLRLDAQVLPVLYPDGPPDVTKGFHVHRRGRKICLVATGYMVHTAFIVADRLREAGIDIGLVDLFDLARFSAKALHDELSPYQTIVSMEEGFAGRGGLDALLYNFLGHGALDAKLLNVGVEGGYRFELGSRAELHEQVGIGPDVVTKRLLQISASSSKTLPPLNGGRPQ
ncbi:transketolase family protein [Bradyrhizobium sp. CCGE-LA001]|uniref:transketolase family protein n=1 Tax=Bradyrhizobium sp. CCGE-LA001 TaxID=1223566 RepID=UPI000745EC14|nr:transketolase C-terminal domain-containing protein [Bradyrhizobium sp. CCGE-LA001]AMA58991.1 transketolase [Bradyrhizobium sp. CCGE-LA001]